MFIFLVLPFVNSYDSSQTLLSIACIFCPTRLASRCQNRYINCRKQFRIYLSFSFVVVLAIFVYIIVQFQQFPLFFRAYRICYLSFSPNFCFIYFCSSSHTVTFALHLSIVIPFTTTANSVISNSTQHVLSVMNGMIFIGSLIIMIQLAQTLNGSDNVTFQEVCFAKT